MTHIKEINQHIREGINQWADIMLTADADEWAEQKKFIGNAVEVNMARVLCEALCKKLNQKKQAV